MEDKKVDIPLPLALVILAATVAVIFGLQFKDGLLTNWSAIKYVVGILKWYLITFASLLFVNSILATHYLRRALGLSKQGARLRAIKQTKEERRKTWLKFSVLFLMGVGIGWVLERALMSGVTITGLGSIYSYQYVLFNINVAFLYWFVADKVLKFGSYISGLHRKNKLPEYPQGENTIVLGSINEEKKELVPEWESVEKSGLNGSILITGSIGTGKTAGAMLPYFKQALTNFNEVSVLALDPKRTFVAEADRLAKVLKPGSVIRRMTLEGPETFNPVYVVKPLKNSRFIDLAEMVRASSINFGGGKNDSPFWEISAFNLIKYCLVYCAATLEYYTLKDVYEAMIKSVSTDLARDLELSKNKRKFNDSDEILFDEEEQYNIGCAIDYFNEEFRNMENKVKTGILATATSFLNQFQEYRAAKVFCPKKEDRTIFSIDSVIDNGEILLFDIESPALARSMGTILKLHYQQSIIKRVSSKERGTDIPAFFFCDEYQDVVTSGGGVTLGDDDFFAKSRQSNSVSIVATQSLSSLHNALSSEKAARELIQNFRTRICFHSADVETIKNMQELVGQDEREKESRSISEIAQKTERNFLIGGFDSKDANISESISVSNHKEYILTGKEFTALKTFEAWGIIFDGTAAKLKKLYMKPVFLENPATIHEEVIRLISEKKDKKKKSLLRRVAASIALLILCDKAPASFPNVCDVLKQPSFRSCLSFQTSPSMCGFPSRPCARISYFVPQTFIETTTKTGVSHFSTLPGAAAQLARLDKVPFGAVNDDDSQSFHSRTIAVPLAQLILSGLPCGGLRQEKMCFDGMSEHLKNYWATGSGDLMQPKFLAWKLSPKLCLMKGAAMVAGAPSSMGADSTMCSVNMDTIPTFPPSSYPVCTAWGVMYPRMGTVVGGSEIIGSLSVASRMKSLSVEIFRSMPGSPGEKWSMISPNSSQCFCEFENIASMEGLRFANNRGRTMGKNLSGNLFATWKKVSCARDWAEVPVVQAEIAILEQVCRGL